DEGAECTRRSCRNQPAQGAGQQTVAGDAAAPGTVARPVEPGPDTGRAARAAGAGSAGTNGRRGRPPGAGGADERGGGGGAHPGGKAGARSPDAAFSGGALSGTQRPARSYTQRRETRHQPDAPAREVPRWRVGLVSNRPAAREEPRMNRSLLLGLCGLAVWAAGTARADDWPQWLGPQRDGVWR